MMSCIRKSPWLQVPPDHVRLVLVARRFLARNIFSEWVFGYRVGVGVVGDHRGSNQKRTLVLGFHLTFLPQNRRLQDGVLTAQF